MVQEVVLLPSFAQVEWWSERNADSGPEGLFARTVTTFDAWIADLWELHGDGRSLVDGAQRHMLIHSAVISVLDDATASEIVPVAMDCMRLASGLPEFEHVVDAARRDGKIRGFSHRELSFIATLARYGDLLEEHGLVEFGEAVANLACHGEVIFRDGVHVLLPQAVPFTWAQGYFFETCEGIDVTVESARGFGGIGRAPAGVEVRFACPSGNLAQPGLVADVIDQVGAAESIVITCVDPIDLFARLEERVGKNRHMCVQARKPFGETDFGRVYLACFDCVKGDTWDPAVLSDVLISPFSGLSRTRAIAWDVRLRADRLARRDEVLQELRAESEPFSQLEELVGDPDADVLIGAFEQRVMADSDRGGAWRAEQIAALGVLRRTMSAARMAGEGMAACIASLENASVPVAIRTEADGPHVLITTQALASQLEPGRFDVAIIADLTSDSYPVGDRDDAASTFFAKLGLEPVEPALMRARRVFCALLELPVRLAVFVRPLGDEKADRTYPAAVLEEFVDAYRDDPANSDDIDNAYRLPEELRVNLVERGEEHLYANSRAGVVDGVQPAAGELTWPDSAEVPPEDVPLVMVPRRDAMGNVLEKACPSPSQIELYLECPYRWFAERRMHPKSVDEQFGALERGSFAHAVLEEFYRRFQETGRLKVEATSLDEARSLMGAVFDELASEQRDKELGSGRYVAVTEIERRMLSGLRAQLLRYLDFEARLLPAFHPAYFEYEIDTDHAVEYAGYLLVGTVDRIDIDDAGHAVIIDYKSSLNKEHEIAGKNWGHAGKVQTRIYAQAVERALGLNVIGALYVSYGRDLSVAGSYDPRVIGATDLPGIKPDHCACGLLEEVPDPLPEDYSLASLAFQRMIDETEAIAGAAVSAMSAGVVGPQPSHAGACRFCQVISCPKRGV